MGTALLGREASQPWAVLFLVVAGALAILAWRDKPWSAAFPAQRGACQQLQVEKRRSVLALLAGAVLLAVFSHVAFLLAPHETFGAAGWLWLAGIALVVAAAARWPGAEPHCSEASGLPAWRLWEVALVAAIAVTAVVLRVWNLRDVPFNIYPDEVMTGSVAERAYLSGPAQAPVFSTLWSDIELPALWFALVAGVLKLGGIGLGVVRLPAALFGAATVLPFYGFVRCVWGRAAAIAGASIMAFSAANVHYSRMALNNITTPFFWTVVHPGSYYGRGASLMTWNRIPANWHDLQQMWHTLWPIISENLLGISTQSAQDIMYYAPLLLKAEAAILVLGVAFLIWRWQHPAAFLVLLSGVGVIFVGGTLVLYPNSSPPMLAHWTPAFPAFYAAIAVPIGAWVASARALQRMKSMWISATVVAIGLAILGYANVRFYFFRYYADPENLRSDHYKAAQRLYEVQTVQSRYMASLGSAYRVVVVGKSPYPYDAEITRYLVQGQEYILAYDPQIEPPLAPVAGKGMAFLFFAGSEQYQERIRELYPGGRAEEVRNPVGRHVFYVYIVEPKLTPADSAAQ
ncbi:MAG: hypothetical protein DMC60_04680 [Verrucomicrobia bacterium]|nr:MAG: hypothetical protein DMC60_04680 [Verrucomicrobiota bacterium]